MTRTLRNSQAVWLPILLVALFAAAVHAQIIDSDGDGVADDLDLCPAENASFFDGDGDGCLDPTSNARHIEFWAPGDLPLRYVIHEAGAPIVTDGSDFAAIQAGYTAWTVLPGVQLTALAEGTTAQANADGTDGVNHVTFQDPDFVALYGNAVLAVGITTSFTTATEFNGQPVRPGQIVDADMLFNPNRTFRTASGGSGPDLQSVATHEAGHLFGFSHSCVASATMFPALPGGVAARSLEMDDRVLALMGYPDPALLPVATALSGTIRNGANDEPLAGAAVFAISAANGDTLGCQYTLPDGSYLFVGLPEGGCFVSVYPLDGSVGIGGVVPGLINALVDSTAVTIFVPEAWDLAESSGDDASARDPVTLTAGAPVTGIDILTNVDAVSPTIVEVAPADGSVNVRADAVLAVKFDEAIDFESARTNFRLARLTTSGPEGVGGALVLLSNGRTLLFDPTDLLVHDAEYELTLEAGIADLFGNSLGTDQVFGFSVESAPPLHIDTIAPSFVAPGALAVISGVSFDTTDPAANVVHFGGIEQPAESVTVTALVVRVPDDLPLGEFALTVTTPGGGASNAIDVVGLSSFEAARGTPIGGVDLGGVPRTVASLPDGRFTYAATSGGLACVVTDPNLGDFLTALPISIEGGAVDVAITPDGTRAYAVSRDAQLLVVVNTDYVDPINRSPLFNTVLDELPVGAAPLGIAVAPSGQRVYVATAESMVQVWDVVPGSATYNSVVGEIVLPATPAGRLAVDPTGSRLLVLASTGSLFAYDTATLAESGAVAVGSDPRDIAFDPQGRVLYVSRGVGDVAVVALSTLDGLATVPISGALRGLAVSPAGGLGYVANRSDDALAVIDLNGSSPSYLSVASTFETESDPVDVTVSPDGLLVCAVEEGSRRLSMFGVGFGPVVETITPQFGRPGDLVVIAGEGFAAMDTSVAAASFSTVLFGDQSVPLVVGPEPFSSTGEHLWVRVPADYAGEPIRVTYTGASVFGLPDTYLSNPLNFRLLGEPSFRINQAVFLGQASGYDWGAGVRQALEASPTNEFMLAVDLSNQLYWIDTSPSSPHYGEAVVITQLPQGGSSVNDIAIQPDGRRAFVSYDSAIVVHAVDTDRLSPSFGQVLGTIDWTALETEPFAAGGLTIHPGGKLMIVENDVNDGLVFVDLDQLAAISSTGPLGYSLDLAIHPSGQYAYFASSTGNVHVINLDSFSPQYLSQVNLFVPDAEQSPRSIAFDPDGSRAFIITRGFEGTGNHDLEVLDTTNPAEPLTRYRFTLEANSPPTEPILRVSPNGDRAFCDIPGVGGIFLDITEEALSTEAYEISRIGLNGTGDRMAVAFTADSERMFTASRGDTGLNMVEFTPPVKLDSISGNNQVGVAGQRLPAPLRIRIEASDTSLPIAGATGEVRVTGGGGTLGNGEAYQWLASDASGAIEIDWTLGPLPDTDPDNPANRLQVSFYSQFTVIDNLVAVSVADPSTLPLRLAQLLPGDLSANISITTTAQATFSRAVDRATVTPLTLSLRRQSDGATVPTVYGFADGDRRVSLIPISTLESSTAYELVVAAGLLDTGGGPLLNPSTSTFTTQAPPPLAVNAVAAPAAPVGAEVIISGQGFSATPGENRVLFNDLPVTPIGAQVNALRAIVPIGAVSGSLTVDVGGVVSVPVPFNVLVGTDAPLNEIVQTTPTGITVRSIAVTPDGATAYAVSPETDQVIPLDLDTLLPLPGIPVGDQPVAIVVHPNGLFAYVANFGSGTISVITTTTNSTDATINVGNEPVDLVASPAGDRLYVVNSLDQTLSVVDIDPTHATFHTVVTTVPAGSTSKGSAISPDGTRLYLGAVDGFLIIDLDPLNFGVVTHVPNGSTTKGAAVSPDGTLLILVTAGGDVLLIDITPDGGNAVVTTVPAGSSTKGAAVSPDGTLLYILQENSDDVLVFSLEIIGSVGVVEPGDGLGTLQVRLTPLGAIQVGNDPLVIAFDPTGSGLAIVANGGGETVTFLNASSTPYAQVEAELRIEPHTLNNENDLGRIKAYLTFPAGVFPQNVDLATVRLQGEIPPVPGYAVIQDPDQDGVSELVLKFDRARFQEVIPQGEYVPVAVTGRLTQPDRAFVARDTVRVIRPTVTFPEGGEVLLSGTTVAVTWTSPIGYHVSAVDVRFTLDDGATWTPIAEGIADDGTVPWTVPVAMSDQCRVVVIIYDSQGNEKGAGMSQGPFTIRGTPTAVAFVNVAVEAVDGDGLLRWTLPPDVEVDGFNVLRALSEEGELASLTETPVTARVGDDGTGFEFRDTDVIAGQSYYYQLEEIRDGGPGFRHGPYRLVVEARNALDQNYPNAFNPKTIIRFSLAQEARTRLVIFDLAGRRVRTLVDAVLRPDVYRLEWDGRSDAGSPVASGVYLYRLDSADFSATRKMMLLR